MLLKAIYATDPNGVIGVMRDGKFDQPFKCKKDFDWFKNLTKNQCVIMGYNTYKAIGKALPNRTNIVLTSHEINTDNLIIAYSIKEALALAENQGFKEVWFIGGADVLKQVYAFLDELYITKYDQYAELDRYNIVFNPQYRQDFLAQESQRFHDTDLITRDTVTGEFIHYKSFYYGEPK